MKLGTQASTLAVLCFTGTQLLLPKGTQPPVFGLYLLRPHGYMDQDTTWYGDRPRPKQLCVRWTPLPLPKRGGDSKFSACVYCGQTAGWINMDVGLSTGDFLLDGDPAPLPKRGQSPQIFGPCLLWPNGCMDQGVTWYGSRPRPTRHCVRLGPS